MNAKSFVKVSASIMLAMVLSACATKSHVSSEGTTDNPVFPAVDKVSPSFAHNRGTFPTTDELAQVKAGMTKDQMYKLLGRPHFNEGMFRVREWDYLFHFPTPGQGTNDVTTCQFKILYDNNMFTRSFFWQAVDPVDAVCPPATPSTTQNTRSITLNADALFEFDKSGEKDMKAAAKPRLDHFANEVKRFSKVNAIRISGHTDRLGNDDYNMNLSERRAETVRRYLVARGVPAGVMSAQGLGENQPVVTCSEQLPRQELISCLQPNRRVEIQVDGLGDLTVN